MNTFERPPPRVWFRLKSRRYEIKERPKSYYELGNYRKTVQDDDQHAMAASNQSAPPTPEGWSPFSRPQSVPTPSTTRPSSDMNQPWKSDKTEDTEQELHQDSNIEIGNNESDGETGSQRGHDNHQGRKEITLEI